MSFAVRYALPALAVAGSAYAACSASATATIQNSGDAAAITSCSTFSGSIAVATGVTDNINLNGIKKIDGNLVAGDNSELRTIGADSLEEITGTFKLDDLQQLSSLEFPKLKAVKSIEWLGLQTLEVLGFTAEVTEAENVRIENTRLTSLTGINLETAKTINLANNPQIEDISMQLGNVTESMTLADNNENVNVTLPNLIWAFNLTFRSCASVEVPSLESLNGSLGLYSGSFTNFRAPNLTDIGGALAIVDNTELSNLTIPNLTKIGANFEVANNTKLSELTGFGKLESIGASFDCNGNMTKVDMPKLNGVRGTFNLQSTGDIGKTCSDFFQPLKDKDRIQGEFTCEGKLANPGGQGTEPTPASGSKPTGAASPLTMGSNALFAGLVAAIFL